MKFKYVSEHTDKKLRAVERIFKEMSKSYSENSLHIDLNAGNGSYKYKSTVLHGSPLIALDAHKKQTRFIFIDKNRNTIKELLKSICKHSASASSDVRIINSDNLEFSKNFTENTEGLVFADPCGAGKRELPACSYLAQNTKMDIVFHYQYTSAIRAWGTMSTPLVTGFKAINRRYKLITQPNGKWNFGLFIATDNLLTYETLKNMRICPWKFQEFIGEIPTKELKKELKSEPKQQKRGLNRKLSVLEFLANNKVEHKVIENKFDVSDAYGYWLRSEGLVTINRKIVKLTPKGKSAIRYYRR